MPQSMLAFLAMAMVIQLAMTQHRSEIQNYESMVEDEMEMMANAVALEQIEVIEASTDWDSLYVWNDSVTTRTFQLGTLSETFKLGVSVQYMNGSGKASAAATTIREVSVAAMNDRYKLPVVTHARLISK
jgi:hypothetical protein